MRKLFLFKNAQVSGIRDPLPISPEIQKIEIQIFLCSRVAIGPQHIKKSAQLLRGRTL